MDMMEFEESGGGFFGSTSVSFGHGRLDYLDQDVRKMGGRGPSVDNMVHTDFFNGMYKRKLYQTY